MLLFNENLHHAPIIHLETGLPFRILPNKIDKAMIQTDISENTAKEQMILPFKLVEHNSKSFHEDKLGMKKKCNMYISNEYVPIFAILHPIFASFSLNSLNNTMI